MELEELKNLWTSLNERLSKQEKMKESIIKEMIYSKSEKSLNKLINYDIFGAVTLILLIPFLAWSYLRFGGRSIMWDILIIYTMIACTVAIFWIIYKLKELIKINFTKEISLNIYILNRYNIQTKRERRITNVFAGPIFVVLLVLTAIEVEADAFRWIVIAFAILLATFGSHFQDKRIYDKNIEEIQRSMEELKDLEEES